MTLTLGDKTAGVANEFLFQFTSGSEPTSLTLPDDIKWVNDTAPTIAENKIYQISILNGLGICLEFENIKSLFPITLHYGNNGDIGIEFYNYLLSEVGFSHIQFESGLVTYVDGNNVSHVVTEMSYEDTGYSVYVEEDGPFMTYHILTNTGVIETENW